MDDIHLPSAEKKRAETASRGSFIRKVLLRPKTWTTALSALDWFLKLVRMVKKLWDLFQ